MLGTIFIGQGAEYLQVAVNPSALPYVSSSSNPAQGMLRVTNNQMEVFNGTSWQQIYEGSASVGLSSKTIDILKWADAKMHMEREIMTAVENNVTVADAYRTYKEAADRLTVVMALVEKEEKLP
jgi:hypothetical protein